MALAQPATFNEAWPDSRVFAYLDHLPPQGESADFFVLYNAYKHMRVADFERLLVKFTANGRDINATNSKEQRIHDVIAGYPRHADEFLNVLQKFA